MHDIQCIALRRPSALPFPFLPLSSNPQMEVPWRTAILPGIRPFLHSRSLALAITLPRFSHIFLSCSFLRLVYNSMGVGAWFLLLPPGAAVSGIRLRSRSALKILLRLRSRHNQPPASYQWIPRLSLVPPASFPPS